MVDDAKPLADDFIGYREGEVVYQDGQTLLVKGDYPCSFVTGTALAPQKPSYTRVRIYHDDEDGIRDLRERLAEAEAADPAARVAEMVGRVAELEEGRDEYLRLLRLFAECGDDGRWRVRPFTRAAELIGNLADEFWQEGANGASYGGMAVAERLRLLRQELVAAPASDAERVAELEAQVAQLTLDLAAMTSRRNSLSRSLGEWADLEGSLLEREAALAAD